MESHTQINEEISSAFSTAIATNDVKLYNKTWKKAKKLEDGKCIEIDFMMDTDTFDMLTRFMTDYRTVFGESYHGISYDRLKRFESFFIRRGRNWEDIIKATDFFEQFPNYIYGESSFWLIQKALDKLGRLKLDLLYLFGSGAWPIFEYLTGYSI